MRSVEQNENLDQRLTFETRIACCAFFSEQLCKLLLAVRTEGCIAMAPCGTGRVSELNASDVCPTLQPGRLDSYADPQQSYFQDVVRKEPYHTLE